MYVTRNLFTIDFNKFEKIALNYEKTLIPFNLWFKILKILGIPLLEVNDVLSNGAGGRTI